MAVVFNSSRKKKNKMFPSHFFSWWFSLEITLLWIYWIRKLSSPVSTVPVLLVRHGDSYALTSIPELPFFFVSKWISIHLHVSETNSALLRRWLVRGLYVEYVIVRLWKSVMDNGWWITNYGFGLSGRSVPPEVDSDKLRKELHS